MIDRFTRAMNVVRDHKIGSVIGAGVVAVTTLVMNAKSFNQPGIITKVKVTSEQLQYLIDNTEGVISFDASPKRKIWVINAASREEL